MEREMAASLSECQQNSGGAPSSPFHKRPRRRPAIFSSIMLLSHHYFAEITVNSLTAQA